MLQGPIVFVSNFDLANRKGGFDGLGGKIYDILTEKLGEIVLVDNINPGIPLIDRYASKLFRKAGLPAKFPAFSEKRLRHISNELEHRLPSNSRAIIFHGITPWIAYHPSIPYFAFTDCSFYTYMDLYHHRPDYSIKDLERIGHKEGLFMANAKGIFFTGEWSMNEARRQYKLKGDNLLKMGQGPTMEIPANAFDGRMPRKQFVFIGTDFIGKGGREICRAFQKLYAKDPEYKLIIIGQKPPDEFLQIPGIEFLGYVNKSSEQGKQQFSEIYRNSRALLMLTKKDIFPIVLIESGLHGCPSVANRISSIPEVIQDGLTGYLIENTQQELEETMMKLAKMNDQEVMAMRKYTSSFYEQHYSWEEIYGHIHSSMKQAGVVL